MCETFKTGNSGFLAYLGPYDVFNNLLTTVSLEYKMRLFLMISVKQDISTN